MASLNLTLNAQVVGGPQVSASRTKQIEAYDKVDVMINPGDTDVEVTIQPGAAGQVGFLLIKSSLYSQAAADQKLTYFVVDGGSDFPAAGDGLELNDPHVYIGGALAVFGLAPRALRFTSTYVADPTNPTVNRAVVEILVGRSAIAP
ncbi:hypothetical protein [Phormidium tenue]|uniref:Uncharacterized protein n=1 Tax=Phormidium tenue NIES-30 TaxID=549789 RepID=A0A1U7IYI9_9CYAN|nr:hypothetical protein [Phormidium tenue]MBD2232771.1 hypothetical protein [Phormidium tenue FACHB-1052]OKH43707.1 hypothetical protein NIES30_24455 [Phormidium tenue NIES-30]